jgi:hypothetical protein
MKASWLSQTLCLDIVRFFKFLVPLSHCDANILRLVAHVTFFGLISETQDPRFFPRSLAMLQITDTVLYLVAGLVIYRFAGEGVESPAPSSAGPLMKKICYGLAIPTVRASIRPNVSSINF